MPECDLGCVQKQPGGGVTVEFVTNDGAAQTLAAGTMHAQLMGASGQRMQFYTAVVQHPVVGNGLPSVGGVDELPRTVVEIGAQGQRDTALVRCWPSLRGWFQERDISFLDFMVGKLALQPLQFHLVQQQ